MVVRAIGCGTRRKHAPVPGSAGNVSHESRRDVCFAPIYVIQNCGCQADASQSKMPVPADLLQKEFQIVRPVKRSSRRKQSRKLLSIFAECSYTRAWSSSHSALGWSTPADAATNRQPFRVLASAQRAAPPRLQVRRMQIRTSSPPRSRDRGSHARRERSQRQPALRRVHAHQ